MMNDCDMMTVDEALDKENMNSSLNLMMIKAKIKVFKFKKKIIKKKLLQYNLFKMAISIYNRKAS